MTRKTRTIHVPIRLMGCKISLPLKVPTRQSQLDKFPDPEYSDIRSSIRNRYANYVANPACLNQSLLREVILDAINQLDEKALQEHIEMLREIGLDNDTQSEKLLQIVEIAKEIAAIEEE